MSTCPACGEYFPELDEDDICEECTEDFNDRRMSDGDDDAEDDEEDCD